MLIYLLLAIKCIVILSMQSEKLKFLNETETIREKVYLSYEDVQNASHCLRRVLSISLSRIGRIPFFIATTNLATLKANLILQSLLNGEISIYLLSRYPRGSNYSSSDRIILFTDNLETLMQNTQPDFTLLCFEQCFTYIVILTREFASAKEFLRDVKNIIKFLWKQKIANVVVVAMVERIFLFSRSQKFTNNVACEPEDPKFVDACNFDEYQNLKLSQILFENMKTNNCLLKVAVLPREPYIVVGNYGKISGVEGEIFNTISPFIPFRFKSNIAFKPDYRDLVAIPKNLLSSNKNIFFIAGGIPSIVNEGIDFTIPYDVRFGIFNDY